MVIINLLSMINKYVGVVLIILFFLSLMFFCLLEGYLFYGIKKIEFKKVVHIKNVLKLYLIELIAVSITATVCVILFLIFNHFIAAYIAFPFVEICIISISLIAESYVVELVKKEGQPVVKEKKQIAKKA